MTSVSRRSLLLLAGLMLAGWPAGAARASLPPGCRVRVTAPAFGFDKRTFTVLSAGRDTLSLSGKDGRMPVHLPLSALKELDVSAGRKGHVIAGVVTGFLVGGVVGGLAGASSFGDNEWVGPPLIIISVGLGASLGALAGGGVGAIIRTERWEPVPFRYNRIDLKAWFPAAGGAGIGASLVF